MWLASSLSAGPDNRVPGPPISMNDCKLLDNWSLGKGPGGGGGGTT
jgi:hypothetical protein